MVALPGQLFTNPQIPACIWLLTKNKTGGGARDGKRDRQSEVLFLNARDVGFTSAAYALIPAYASTPAQPISMTWQR